MLKEVPLLNKIKDDNVSADEIQRISRGIAKLLAENGISLTQIAERAQVAPSTVASLANPEGSRGSNPRASTLKKIKDAYPSFMEGDTSVEMAITGYCYFGKINPPRALEPSSIVIKRSGMIDYERMSAIVIKRTSAPRAQAVFENAYFFHPKDPKDAIPPEQGIGKLCVVYERRDDVEAAGAVWLGILERAPDSPTDLVLVSLGGDGVHPNSSENPLIIAPKAERNLNIEYVMLIYGMMLQAQIDAFLDSDKTAGSNI
jgi:transcriptional regulator with XRE-family HTH domain